MAVLCPPYNPASTPYPRFPNRWGCRIRSWHSQIARRHVVDSFAAQARKPRVWIAPLTATHAESCGSPRPRYLFSVRGARDSVCARQQINHRARNKSRPWEFNRPDRASNFPGTCRFVSAGRRFVFSTRGLCRPVMIVRRGRRRTPGCMGPVWGRKWFGYEGKILVDTLFSLRDGEDARIK